MKRGGLARAWCCNLRLENRGTNRLKVATLNVAGLDAHETYLVVAVVSKAGELLQRPTRIANTNAFRLLELLEGFCPIEAVVERVQRGRGSTISSRITAMASCSRTRNGSG